MATQLAPTLGWEKSVDAVMGAVRRLGLHDGNLTGEDRTAILEDLALESGIVGVTARYVLSRAGRAPSGMTPAAELQSSPPPDDTKASARLAATVGVHEIVGPLAALLGGDKGEAVVMAGIRRLGLPRERLDREQVARLIDDLCRQEGHVGTTARFVRGRVLAKLAP